VGSEGENIEGSKSEYTTIAQKRNRFGTRGCPLGAIAHVIHIWKAVFRDNISITDNMLTCMLNCSNSTTLKKSPQKSNLFGITVDAPVGYRPVPYIFTA